MARNTASPIYKPAPSQKAAVRERKNEPTNEAIAAVTPENSQNVAKLLNAEPYSFRSAHLPIQPHTEINSDETIHAISANIATRTRYKK